MAKPEAANNGFATFADRPIFITPCQGQVFIGVGSSSDAHPLFGGGFSSTRESLRPAVRSKRRLLGAMAGSPRVAKGIRMPAGSRHAEALACGSRVEPPSATQHPKRPHGENEIHIVDLSLIHISEPTRPY